MALDIINLKPEHISARNALLQKTLRSDNHEYSITCEYPLLMSQEGMQYSYTIVAKEAGEDIVCAHAHFWPRELQNETTGEIYKIALIGNVASDPRFRGRGLMRRLFEHFVKLAEQQGFLGLFLWSELLQFYHKLGFSPFGSELRISLRQDPRYKVRKTWSRVSVSEMSKEKLDRLMSSRYATKVSLKRSLDEFFELLAIPDTILLVDDFSLQKPNYCILGKGADMIGVIHEWGMQDAKVLADCAQHILQRTGWSQVMVLTPSELPKNFIPDLAPQLMETLTHFLALYHPVGQGLPADIESSCFFWGLDCI